MVKYDFKNKVALVTGAASGMGLAATKRFAINGAAVVMADINRDLLLTECGKLVTKGFDVFAIVCDTSNEEQVKAMIDETVKRYGRLDFAYNNAGIMSPMTDIADVATSEYDRILNINLRGIFLCMKYELKVMGAQGTGAIVNCSSLGGLVGNPGRAPYHASKHGVLGLTKSAAIEYAPKGIRINAVCPGTIETPMVEHMEKTNDLSIDEAIKATPIKRLGTVDEVASVVLWLCSDDASYVVGQSIAVDGGYTII